MNLWPTFPSLWTQEPVFIVIFFFAKQERQSNTEPGGVISAFSTVQHQVHRRTGEKHFTSNKQLCGWWTPDRTGGSVLSNYRGRPPSRVITIDYD